MPVNSAGAEEKASRIAELIQQKIAETMPVIAAQLALDSQMRAPTVDEEYNALMAESGHEAAVPREGDFSADQDDRVRMIKPEETYLFNAVINPANVKVTETSAAIGYLPFLETCAKYRYINLMRTGKDEHEQMGPHEVGPYLDAVISGGSALIVPVFTLMNGHKYRLRPVDDNSDPGVDTMTKSFSPHPMFAPFNLLAVARETLTTALAEMNGA